MKEVAGLLFVIICLCTIILFIIAICLYYVITNRKTLKLQEVEIDSQLAKTEELSNALSYNLEQLKVLEEELYGIRSMIKPEEQMAAEQAPCEQTMRLYDDCESTVMHGDFNETIKAFCLESLKEERNEKIVNIR